MWRFHLSFRFYLIIYLFFPFHFTVLNLEFLLGLECNFDFLDQSDRRGQVFLPCKIYLCHFYRLFQAPFKYMVLFTLSECPQALRLDAGWVLLLMFTDGNEQMRAHCSTDWNCSSGIFWQFSAFPFLLFIIIPPIIYHIPTLKVLQILISFLLNPKQFQFQWHQAAF